MRSLAPLLTALLVACGPPPEPTEAPPDELDIDMSRLGLIDCTERNDTGYVDGNPFTITVVTVDGKPAERDTANAYWVMQQAAAADGVQIAIVSGFRTQAEQEYLYDCYINCNCNNCNLAARPGYSNHQSGHALDLNTSSGGVLNWLNNNGGAFGFSRTVPSEDWHWEWWGGGPGGGPCQGCNSSCNGTVMTAPDCSTEDCALGEGTCVDDTFGVRCEPRCPALPPRGWSDRRDRQLLQRLRSEQLLAERRRRRLRRRPALDQRIRERPSQQLGPLADRATRARRIRARRLSRSGVGRVLRRPLRGPPRRRRHGALARSVGFDRLGSLGTFAMSSGASLSVFDNTMVPVAPEQHISVDAIRLVRVQEPPPPPPPPPEKPDRPSLADPGVRDLSLGVESDGPRISIPGEPAPVAQDPVESEESGCSCSATSSAPQGSGAIVLLLSALLLRRRGNVPRPQRHRG